MAGNPPPINVPKVADPALQSYLTQLKDAVYLLWYQTGSGVGIVPIAGGGTGSDTEAGARDRLGLEIGSDIQAQDAGLQSIADLATVADRTIYTTASDTYSTTAITAYGRSLIATANAAALQTLAGLEPGSDVQAEDAGLTSIAGLTTAANQMLYLTGSDVYAVATLTAFARTLLDDSDAATARGTLGLGSADTVTFDTVISASNAPATAASTGTAGTITWDSDYIYVCIAADTWKRVPISTW